ncbi:MAG: hypothetical protein [Wendovervirus sonii]|uniref:Uncharacterized protein n=1 Tax=phage Lak_Megaphage_Sonny TaxID=3109229 RepID=A0ABZ0Z5S7_9CAUD|nr:MAG: hypothetical protein [phage Lak_Megaphage_Sonny]
MNKKQLYESIMRTVSHEVKKALNENYDENNKQDLIEKIIALVSQDEYDISELKWFDDTCWNGEEDIEYYFQTIDKDGLHSCPEWDIENLECYTPEPLSSLDNLELEDIQKLYNCIIEQN